MARFRGAEIRNAVGVGLTGPREARIWLRAERPGRFLVSWAPEDAAASGAGSKPQCFEFAIPDDNDRDNTHSLCIGRPAGHDLRPDSAYHYRVRRSDESNVLGEGRFHTAPDPGGDVDRLSFLVASCHQPFDRVGLPQAGARAMLRAVQQLVAERDVRFLLLMGDQMYADCPQSLSLFEPGHFATVAPPGRRSLLGCTAAEVRRIFQQRYRRWWNVPEWQALLASVPTLPILDDHEIIDNWGSDPDHQSHAWQAVAEGARAAYADYQSSRVLAPGPLPHAFDFDFAHGPIAVHVLDLRSNRCAGDGTGRLYSDEQQARFETFLERNADKELLFVVLSVPPVHLPQRLARAVSRCTRSGEDFSDRWSTLAHVRDRDRMLRLLRDHQRRHPEQRLVVLSGDIHIGCAHAIRWEGIEAPLYQLVSSGLTHHVGRVTATASSWAMAMNRNLSTEDGDVTAAVTRLTDPGSGRNPYTRRNCALVELERERPGAPLRARFSLFGHSGERPICVYRSPRL